jgi:DinB family protein
VNQYESAELLVTTSLRLINESLLKRTFSRLNSIHRNLAITVAAVDPSLVAVRPAEDQWSIAEVLDHLCLVEERVLAELEKGAAAPPQKAGVMKKLIPMALISWRFVKVKAPRAVHPTSDLSREQLLEKYDRTRDRLKEFCFLQGADRLKQILFRHPLLGKIDGVATVSFIAFHERRHHKQIQEILSKLKRANSL